MVSVLAVVPRIRNWQRVIKLNTSWKLIDMNNFFFQFTVHASRPEEVYLPIQGTASLKWYSSWSCHHIFIISWDNPVRRWLLCNICRTCNTWDNNRQQQSLSLAICEAWGTGMMCLPSCYDLFLLFDFVTCLRKHILHSDCFYFVHFSSCRYSL